VASDDALDETEDVDGKYFELSGGGEIWVGKASDGNLWVQLRSKLKEDELSSGQVSPRTATEVVDGFSVTHLKFSLEAAGALYKLLGYF